MKKVILSLVAVVVLSLGGCSAVSSAVDTTFKVAHGLGSLGAASTRHSIRAVEGGMNVAQGGLNLASGAIGLLDRASEADHRAQMRKLEQQRSADASMR